MNPRNWLGIFVTGAMCVRYLPLPAKASYYLQVAAALAAFAAAAIWFSDEYRKDPKVLKVLVVLLVATIVVTGGVVLVVRFAPQ